MIHSWIVSAEYTITYDVNKSATHEPVPRHPATNLRRAPSPPKKVPRPFSKPPSCQRSLPLDLQAARRGTAYVYKILYCPVGTFKRLATRFSRFLEIVASEAVPQRASGTGHAMPARIVGWKSLRLPTYRLEWSDGVGV